MEVFSGPSNEVNAEALLLDQAPAAPVLGDPFYDENGQLQVPFTCPTTDFDGTPMTPNGSGSTGCDNFYLCGAKKNSDGTSALDGLGGADAKNSFLLYTSNVTPGFAGNAPVTLPALPGGGTYKIVGYVSDGQP